MHAEDKVNILLVDDQPANLVALEAILADLGQNLVKAHSGSEALRFLLADDFAVILLDIQMQDLDGFETARLIRGREKSRPTPIIFLTAYERADFSVAEAYTLGAVDYLVKPLVPGILRAKVAGFVELSRKTEQVKRQAEKLREMERQEFQRRLAEERQRWELERLREESRRKDEFLAILGHELRNPLAPLRNAVQVLRAAGLDNAMAAPARDIIERQVSYMSRLIDDLLDVSRITRGKITLRKQAVELHAAVADAVDTCRPLIAERCHELALELPPAPLWLEADPARLKQIITNLLTNAAKYTEPNGRLGLIAERADQEVVLRVRDNGMGIPPEMLDRVFEMFTQVNRCPGSESQWGLGVGLTLVKSLVELHGGTVGVSSAGVKQGSEFVVRLPVIPEPAPEAPRPDTEDLSSGQGLRVLVADDHVDAASSLGAMLRLWGHHVHTVNDGRAAIEEVRAHPFDVVILDIGMPGLDGYEVGRRIRQLPGREQVILLALTGYGQHEDRQRSQEAGFDAHLVKPADLQILQDLLARPARPLADGALEKPAPAPLRDSALRN
jgi:signal transduction histidine kinase